MTFEAPAAILDSLWAKYDAATLTQPTGSPDIAYALGFAAFHRKARDWGEGLNGRPINILDLNPYKNGWEAAKASSEAHDDFMAWRSAWMPGGE